MTHREKIKEIAERCWMDEETSTNRDEDIRIIEQAILAGIEAVLGAEPSNAAMNYGAMMLRDFQSPGTAVRSLQTQLHLIYIEMERITSAELIKELNARRYTTYGDGNGLI